MSVDDLEREILKVTKQGGIARVPEETLVEAFDELGEGPDQLEEWEVQFCKEHYLRPDQDKDMFGMTEHLFLHT